jgi:hypothetical protein
LRRAWAKLPGDFNRDDKVDAADLLKWQGDFSQTANSDADNDGDSDGADFLAWKRQPGAGAFTPSTAAGQPTPEPHSAIVGIMAFCVCVQFQRRSEALPPCVRR